VGHLQLFIIVKGKHLGYFQLHTSAVLNRPDQFIILQKKKLSKTNPVGSMYYVEKKSECYFNLITTVSDKEHHHGCRLYAIAATYALKILCWLQWIPLLRI
jgi:hypothetical protein